MSTSDRGPLSRELLAEYFHRAVTPRGDWMVGMEIEKLGRSARDGAPVPYETEGAGPSIHETIRFLQDLRGGTPVMEGHDPIGIDADWGGISLEPGGQVEWSSRPCDSLTELELAAEAHLDAMSRAAEALGIRWLESGTDPDLPLEAMTWMPKARYEIMRPYLGERGSLAHRMMTQTASIQCAYDFESDEDWALKFLASALMTPIATALFANSSRMDGKETGFRAYRQWIWKHTDPARCSLPAVVFEPGFSMERWLDWVLDVPTIMRNRGGGQIPAGGVPFRELMQLGGCDAVKLEDWETHLSTIFTEVRSYTYLEVRSADLQPDASVFDVPTFWTGILYDDDAMRAAIELGSAWNDHARWSEAHDVSGREGLDGSVAGRSLREFAAEALSIAVAGLRGNASCVGDRARAAARLERAAERHRLALTC